MYAQQQQHYVLHNNSPRQYCNSSSKTKTTATATTITKTTSSIATTTAKGYLRKFQSKLEICGYSNENLETATNVIKVLTFTFPPIRSLARSFPVSEAPESKFKRPQPKCYR